MLGKYVKVGNRYGVIEWVTELPTIWGSDTYYWICLNSGNTIVAMIDEIEVIQ